MMQKEFEGLTGVIVSTSEYALIEKSKYHPIDLF